MVVAIHMGIATNTVVRKHPAALCEQCPLYGRPTAPSQIPQNPVAAVVSRSPGYHEGLAGKPFSGPSGKVLNHLLAMNGVSRHEVMVTNTVLCAPPEGKVPPEAIKACAPRLKEELTGIPLVVACGSEAVGELCGRGSIDRFRGYRISQGQRTVVATNNPALVLRDDSTFPNLKRDFRRAFHPEPPPKFPTVTVIEDVNDACRYIASLRETRGIVACDIESRGGLSHKASLVSIQFSTTGTNAVVLGECQGLFHSEHFLGHYLRPFLESTDHEFIWHGGKFDTKILRHTYQIGARVDHDTMLLSYALDERSGSDERIGVHGLDYLLMDNFGWPHYSSPAIDKAKKTGVIDNYEAFYKYAGMDVGGTYQLFELLMERAKTDNVVDAYNLLIRANEFLIGVELHGMVYDVKAASDLHEFVVLPELEQLTISLREQVDKPLLNPRSPVQVAKIVYDEWGVKHEMQSRPDKAKSIDDAAREEILADRFIFRGITVNKRVGNTIVTEQAEGWEARKEEIKDFVENYHRFQKLQKQDSTYILSMIERAESDPNSRIYTQLNLHGTNSGRLSSSRPNLQNITRTKEGLPDIRRLFRGAPGTLIVQADFSQAELRCIAALSGDKELSKIYTDGLDLHDETARRFFGPDFTKEQRATCKNVNFGVFYRQSAETFQEKHGIDARRAQEYIDWVWSTFTGVRDWENDIEGNIHKKSELVSPFGRKRRFYLITEYNKQAIYREGINFFPQSTASDLTLTSGIRIAASIDPTQAAIVNLVHDSVVAEVREDYVSEYSTICKRVMEANAQEELGWTLPFVADVSTGETWGDCK